MPSASTTYRGFPLLALLATSVCLGACTEKTPCSADEELRDGYCYPVDAAAGGTVDAAAHEAGSTFGEPCSTSVECLSPTSYCAIQPPATTGFCSTFGCDKDPTICPSTWACMDLTPYGLAQHLCVPN
jgi:hypothetical protein